MNVFEAESKWDALVGIVVLGLPMVLVGMLADNYVDPLLIWGGADCSTTDGLHACANYPPTGLVLIGLVTTPAVGIAIGYLRGD